MIHTALWAALAAIGGAILLAAFLFVSSRKQRWDRDRRWSDYCARAEAAQRAKGQWRRTQPVGEDLLDALEKIDAGYRYKIKDQGCSWIH
jgi:hypothetical protein